VKHRKHHKSSTDPNECPQGPGETWRYFYKGDYLVVTTVEEAPDLHDEDGWLCVVLHGGAWNYKPGIVLDWAIHTDDDGGWEKVGGDDDS
jgi:hypothetical protein